MPSTYNGKLIRVSVKTWKALNEIKRKRGYKNFDSIVSRMLKEMNVKNDIGKRKKKRKTRNFELFNYETFSF